MISKRENEIEKARRVIDDSPLAVKLINESLDKGDSLDEIFFTSDEYGYSISVTRLEDLTFKISFGCQVAPLAGDGGVGEVEFDESGHVISSLKTIHWNS
jgi:hypothetical protein